MNAAQMNGMRMMAEAMNQPVQAVDTQAEAAAMQAAGVNTAVAAAVEAAMQAGAVMTEAQMVRAGCDNVGQNWRMVRRRSDGRVFDWSEAFGMWVAQS